MSDEENAIKHAQGWADLFMICVDDGSININTGKANEDCYIGNIENANESYRHIANLLEIIKKDSQWVTGTPHERDIALIYNRVADYYNKNNQCITQYTLLRQCPLYSGGILKSLLKELLQETLIVEVAECTDDPKKIYYKPLEKQEKQND
jgi:hypothetical protein